MTETLTGCGGIEVLPTAVMVVSGICGACVASAVTDATCRGCTTARVGITIDDEELSPSVAGATATMCDASEGPLTYIMGSGSGPFAAIVTGTICDAAPATVWTSAVLGFAGVPFDPVV